MIKICFLEVVGKACLFGDLEWVFLAGIQISQREFVSYSQICARNVHSDDLDWRAWKTSNEQYSDYER
jgi:hypothetical protein